MCIGNPPSPAIHLVGRTLVSGRRLKRRLNVQKRANVVARTAHRTYRLYSCVRVGAHGGH
jgi:hypothetical protein